MTNRFKVIHVAEKPVEKPSMDLVVQSDGAVYLSYTEWRTRTSPLAHAPSWEPVKGYISVHPLMQTTYPVVYQLWSAKYASYEEALDNLSQFFGAFPEDWEENYEAGAAKLQLEYPAGEMNHWFRFQLPRDDGEIGTEYAK